MPESTVELWERQDRSVGDRRRLFEVVAEATGATSALYPGSYVDIAPSFSIPDVTYVDVDRRANRFFGDRAGVEQIVQAEVGTQTRTIAFVHADYTDELPLADEAFDLLISLYAGFVSEHCTRHLRIGGTLLVNSSHGDAAMASIDDRYALAGVVTARDGVYRVSDDDLGRHLVPKRPAPITRELLHELGRGIAYTTSPFAYLFRRVS